MFQLRALRPFIARLALVALLAVITLPAAATEAPATPAPLSDAELAQLLETPPTSFAASFCNLGGNGPCDGEVVFDFVSIGGSGCQSTCEDYCTGLGGTLLCADNLRICYCECCV